MENNEEENHERQRAPVILLGDDIQITSEVDDENKMLDDMQVLSLWRAIFNTFVYFDGTKKINFFSDGKEYVSVYDLTLEGKFIENYRYFESFFERDGRKLKLLYKALPFNDFVSITTSKEIKTLLLNTASLGEPHKYTQIDFSVIKETLDRIIANDYRNDDKDAFGVMYNRPYIDNAYNAINNFEDNKAIPCDDVGILASVSFDNFLRPFFINKSDFEDVKSAFSLYIAKYINDGLNKAIDGGSYSVRDNLIRYQFSKKIFFEIIKSSGYLDKYGNEFLLDKDDIRQLYKEKIPIFHTLLALEMDGLIEIKKMNVVYWGKYANEPREYDILIKINEPEKILVSAGKTTTEPFMSLKDHVVSFDDSKPHVSVNGKNCPLPLHKNEHYLCRVMFEYLVGEAIDWSEVFEKMNGFTRKPIGRNEKNDRKSVQDTMYAVNDRVKEILHTKDDLFSWKSNTITRNF